MMGSHTVLPWSCSHVRYESIRHNNYICTSQILSAVIAPASTMDQKSQHNSSVFKQTKGSTVFDCALVHLA